MAGALRVLIADDDPLFLSALELALEAWPEIEIVGMARDGAEAIRLFATTRPDLSILDLAMPRGDGLEVTARIREIDRSAMVLILSSTETAQTLARCLEAGARGCIRKGIGLSTVVPLAVAASGAVKPSAPPPPG